MRTLIAVFICLVISPGFARAQDGTDYKASFLGWSPDSHEFAYILTRYRQKKAPKSFSYMKKISRKRRRAVGRYFKGSVRSRAAQRGFQIKSLPVQKISAYEHHFDVGEERTLRVMLNVGRRKLSYSIWVDDPAHKRRSRRILKGFLRELWSDVVPQAYVSPNGKWVALVIRLSTPFRSRVTVEGIRVSARP